MHRQGPEPASQPAQKEAAVVAAPSTATLPGRAMAMQQSAGNRATARLLRQPKPPEAAPIPEKAESVIMVLPEDRKRIEAETTAEIITAFAAFLDACQSNQASIKAAAKAEAEAFALVLDIATGFLAPAFATFASGRFIGRWTATATKSVQITSGEKMIELISHGDVLKAAFTGVAKVGSDQIKRNATALFGETQEDLFLERLKNEFQSGVVALAGKVPSMTDTELIAVWYAYDPDLANVSTYKERLKTLLDQFQKYIKPITKSSSGDREDYYQYETRVYWMNVYGGRYLALVAGVDDTNMWGTTSTKLFKAWVSPMWQAMAIKRTEALFGAVTELDGKEITGHLPDPHG